MVSSADVLHRYQKLEWSESTGLPEKKLIIIIRKQLDKDFIRPFPLKSLLPLSSAYINANLVGEQRYVEQRGD